MTLVLPDCRHLGDAFFLTPDQRRELLLLLAEKGEAGLDEFVRRHAQGGSQLAKRLARLKQQLLAEAGEVRRRLHTEYDEKREDQRRRTDDAIRRLRQDEERIAAERQRLEMELPEEIRRRVRELPIIQLAMTSPARLPWWTRAWNWVWRIVRAAWLWLRGLLGRAPKLAKPKAIAIGIPGLAGPGIEIEMDLETALRSNPDLRRRIRRGLGETFAARTRRFWRILLGIENYSDVAREILEQEARRAAQAKAGETSAANEGLAGELAKDRAREAEERRLLEEEIARLDAAEAAEEARLREALARRPAEEAKTWVQEEMEAAGLLDRIEGGFRLTGRFLDTFATLVYTEEAKGIASARESALGTSIEGEGILERTRLLSHAETSHMDTVGTLVNARTNHPGNPHLYEEDVLVYREQRATQTHIVIIMDQSLSMAENERIVAAKRAALALYHQTRRRGSRHKIDFILMETAVRRASLADVWDAKPRGFTNVGRALQAAHRILSASNANRKILFLITDGLPEAITEEGKDVAARPEEALQYALRMAQPLRRLPGLAFSVVLLEANDPLFVAAAEKIAKKLAGRVTRVEPQELARSLLVQVRQDELVGP